MSAAAGNIIRNYVLRSGREFAARNAEISRSKILACRDAAAVTAVPAELGLIDRLSLRSLDIESLPDAFVAKGASGHSRSTVRVAARTADGWLDLLSWQRLERNWLRTFASHYVKTRPVAQILLQESLAERRRLPVDCKLYTVRGEVKLALLVEHRFGQVRIAYLNSDWHVVAPEFLFLEAPNVVTMTPASAGVHLESLDAARLAAQELAKRHHAEFCRYDFMIASTEEVWFQEITLYCGGLLYRAPRMSLIDLLVPEDAREHDGDELADYRRRLRSWVPSLHEPGVNADVREAHSEFLARYDAVDADLPLAEFLHLRYTRAGKRGHAGT